MLVIIAVEFLGIYSQKLVGALKKGGTNSNLAHLGLPDPSSKRLLLLEEASLLAWASWVASSSPILL